MQTIETVQEMTTVGDWIQITDYAVVTQESVVDRTPERVHGVKGAVAHVLELESDGWVTAYFERTGDISSVSPDNFKVLCSPLMDR